MQLLKRRFSVMEYHRMAEVGILKVSERVELVRGEIVEMGKIDSRSAARVKRLNHLLTGLFGDRAIVGVRDPVQLSADSEVQPDIALLRLQEDFYATVHPQVSDLLLVVEVSDITLDSDRKEKIPLYAEAEVPETWLANLRDRCVEIYRQPVLGDYLTVKKYMPGDKIAPLSFADCAILVNDILGLEPGEP